MTAKIIKYHPKIKLAIKVNQKKILVGGCFDILHIGHIKFLKAAKKAGDILIVILESDDFIIKHKKRQPYHIQQERAEILSALQFVDYILLLPLFNESDDYQQLVYAVKPQIIAVTDNDPLLKNKIKQAELINARVISVSKHYSDKSTTQMIKEEKNIKNYF